MPKVTAIQSFEHGESIKRGDQFVVSDSIAKQLEGKKLVFINADVATQSEPSAAQQLVSGTAAESIALVEKTLDGDVLREAMKVESEGKSRKTVLDALQTALNLSQA